jgi:hypothetical protein
LTSIGVCRVGEVVAPLVSPSGQIPALLECQHALHAAQVIVGTHLTAL